MRLLFLCFLIFVFDLVVFQPFQLAISDFSPTIIKGLMVAYWSVLVGLVGWLGYFSLKDYKVNNPKQFKIIRSIFYLIYFAKFLFLVFILAFSIIGLLIGGIAYLIPNFDFSNDYTVFFAKISILLLSLIHI